MCPDPSRASPAAFCPGPCPWAPGPPWELASAGQLGVPRIRVLRTDSGQTTPVSRGGLAAMATGCKCSEVLATAKSPDVRSGLPVGRTVCVASGDHLCFCVVHRTIPVALATWPPAPRAPLHSSWLHPMPQPGKEFPGPQVSQSCLLLCAQRPATSHPLAMPAKSTCRVGTASGPARPCRACVSVWAPARLSAPHITPRKRVLVPGVLLSCPAFPPCPCSSCHPPDLWICWQRFRSVC